MSGQYNETRNKQGTPTRIKQWEKKYPKSGWGSTPFMILDYYGLD